MLIKAIMRKRGLLFSVICLAITAWALIGCATSSSPPQSPEEPGPADIEAIKVRSPGSGETVVEIHNSRSASFTSFMLIGPPRLVLDIRAVPGKGLPMVTQVNDGNVTDIRMQHDTAEAMTTRVVVGVSRAVDYTAAEKENTISVTLRPKMVIAEAAQQQEPKEPEPDKGAEGLSVEPRIFFKPRPVGLNQVLGVDFTMLQQGKSRLTVTTDKRVSYSMERKGPKTLVLTLEKAKIPPLLLRRLDSSHFEGAVDKVKSTFSSALNKVSFAIYLRELVPFHVDQTNSEISVDFGPTAIKPPEKKIVPVRLVEAQEISAGVRAETRIAPAEPEPIKVAQAKETPKIPGLSRKKYTGVPMTMDFVNADVTNILRLIGEVSNLNIIWGPDVKGTVSMRLKSVPWDQALDLVLANNDLAMRRQGSVIWITTRAHMAEIEAVDRKKQEEAEAEKTKRLEEQEKAKDLEPLVTEYFPLDFTEAKALQEHIVLSKRGSMSVDARTNTIVMKDNAANIEEARKIVDRFDAPVKQIMIEARIVDASTNFSRDLGVRWNSFERTWQKRRGMAWETDPSAFTTAGDLITGGTFSTNAPDGWGSNIGLTFARLSNRGLGTMALDASLALAETEGDAKIISAPKVIASNGEEATISRGDIIYKEIVTSDQRDIKELPATLSLTVTPTVSFSDYVTMEVQVKDDKVFTDLSGKTEKGIRTKLMVRSGETIVIGGIFKEDKSEKETGIPWLRNIPVFGWLFKARARSQERTELLIFLTPRVVQTAGKTV